MLVCELSEVVYIIYVLFQNAIIEDLRMKRVSI